jgi:hypothetical protein
MHFSLFIFALLRAPFVFFVLFVVRSKALEVVSNIYGFVA